MMMMMMMLITQAGIISIAKLSILYNVMFCFISMLSSKMISTMHNLGSLMSTTCLTRKLSYRKDDRAMRPIYGCHGNFRESLTIRRLRPRLPFAKFIMSFSSDWAYKKLEVHSFTRSWDIRGTQKLAHAPFSPNISNGLLFGGILWMYRPNLKSVALPIPGITAIEVLGWGCEPQSWGIGRRRGGRGIVRKSVGDFL